MSGAKSESSSVRLTKDQVLQRTVEGLYYEFPEQWVPDAIGYTLDEWQKRTIRKLFIGGNAKPEHSTLDWGQHKKARISVRAAHGCGKTFLSAIITHLFLGIYTPSIVTITGPTGKQTSRQLWQYVTTVWSQSVFKDDIDMFGTTMKFKAAPSRWFATWVTSKDPKTVEGFHGPVEGENLLWIVEEAKGPVSGVFEAIQGALSHKHNYWYISSTCGTASGFFFDTFHSKAHVWDNEKVPYYESSRISPDQVKKWEQSWGRDSSIFRARVLAEFPEEDDHILVPLSWCERAIRQPQYGEEYEEAA